MADQPQNHTPFEAVIVDGGRIPFQRSGTGYKKLMAYDLGRMAIEGLIGRAPINGNDLDRVIMGTVIQDVNTALNDYKSYVKQLESSEKALQAAERAYETQKQRYEVGAGTLIELSEANARYVEAQSSRAQALFRVIFQQQILEYYIGKLDQNVSLN